MSEGNNAGPTAEEAQSGEFDIPASWIGFVAVAVGGKVAQSFAENPGPAAKTPPVNSPQPSAGT